MDQITQMQDTKPTLLFSQIDLTNSLKIFKYITEFKEVFDVVYTTFSEAAILDEMAAEENIKLVHILPFVDFDINNKYYDIYERARTIEQEIGIPIQKIIFGDPEFYKIYKNNEELSLAWFVKIWEQYKDIIEKYDIKYHFCFGEDRLHSLIPYHQLKNRGGSSYLLRIIPYYGVTYTKDFFGRFTYWGRIKNEKMIDFEDYAAHIKANKVYYDPKIALSVDYKKYLNIVRLFRRILEIENINWKDRRNIYRNHNVELARNFILSPLIKNVKKTISESLIYQPLRSEGKYIYYPLHYTDDAQVRLKYPEGYNQYELVRNICKNLPINFKLIIKEHPAYIGGYSTREVYNLSKLPNLVVVDPKTSSKDIFNYSDYVITINSTVGYEALFYDKIVITLGYSFYDHFPGIIKLGDVSEIYDALSNTDLINSKKCESKEHLKDATLRLLNASLQYDYYNFYSKNDIVKLRNLLLKHINESS